MPGSRSSPMAPSIPRHSGSSPELHSPGIG
jgi:hypothetical protein